MPIYKLGRRKLMYYAGRVVVAWSSEYRGCACVGRRRGLRMNTESRMQQGTLHKFWAHTIRFLDHLDVNSLIGKSVLLTSGKTIQCLLGK